MLEIKARGASSAERKSMNRLMRKRARIERKMKKAGCSMPPHC